MLVSFMLVSEMGFDAIICLLITICEITGIEWIDNMHVTGLLHLMLLIDVKAHDVICW